MNCLYDFCEGILTCFRDIISGLGACIFGTLKCIKSCLETCLNYPENINCIKPCLIVCCRPLKKPAAYITLKITHYSNWDWIGQRLPLVHFFLLCIPLRFTGYIVALGCFIYSVLCFGLVMKISNQRDKYLQAYADKMDVLVVLVIYLSSTTHFMVTCVFLFVGTVLKCRTHVEIFIWSIIFHVLVNIVSTIVVSIYCIFNDQCFNGSGLAQSVIGLVLTFLYTMMWIYIISSLNSMMENPCPPPPLLK